VLIAFKLDVVYFSKRLKIKKRLGLHKILKAVRKRISFI